MDFSLKNDYTFLFIPAALIISLLISFYYYRKTKLEGFQKKVFTALRFLSLFLLLVLISSPVVSFIKSTSQDPLNIFLIDNSQSLLIENRNDILKQQLDERISGAEPSGSENLYYLFSGNLEREISKSDFDKIPFIGKNNFETNLTSAITALQENLQGRNLSSITIISDGIINEGGNPIIVARQMNVPFNYILIGDTIQKKDLVLKNIFFNKSAFIESIVPIKAEIDAFGFEGVLKVNLYEEGNLIASKDLQTEPGRTSYISDFSVVSPTEKIVRYKIEVQGTNDEITLKNNSQDLFIKFINNKFKVLVLSGGPGADFAFISEELKKINNFELTFLTQKSSTEFYEGSPGNLENFDSYFLIGFPTAATGQPILDEIRRGLEKNNSSLIFFASRNTDYRKLSFLEDKLPFRTASVNDVERETGVDFVNVPGNEIFRNENLMKDVKTFPNVFISGNDFEANPSSETFLISGENFKPVLILQNTDKNKSAAFLAYGLQRWRLSRNKNNSPQVLNYILANTIAAVTNKEAKKNFDVTTERQVYSKYENIRFDARVLNPDLSGNVKVNVKVRGNQFSKDIELARMDSRNYSGEINIPEDGDYTYTGELIADNVLHESVQGRLAIGENNFEYRLTKADDRILKQLSIETGGKIFTGMDRAAMTDLLNKINENSRIEFKRRKNFELNVNPYLLSGIIFLLCLEWFLRKRNSLP